MPYLCCSRLSKYCKLLSSNAVDVEGKSQFFGTKVFLALPSANIISGGESPSVAKNKESSCGYILQYCRLRFRVIILSDYFMHNLKNGVVLKYCKKYSNSPSA